MGGGSGGCPTTKKTQQGYELPLDGGGRVFQIRLGRPHQTKDGASDGQGLRDGIQIQQEISAKVTDGRRERILQPTRDQRVERPRRASFFHGRGYESQRGGTI